MFDRHMIVERDKLLRNARLIRELDEVLAPLLLLDLGCPRQQRFEVAVFGDELCRRLDADAGNARHIIHRVARERLDVDHLVGRDTEFLEDFGLADFTVLHGVVKGDTGTDQLHQVLVGGHDAAGGARLHGLAGISRNQVIRLVVRLLDAGDVEGAGGLADQPELRAEICRSLRPVGLVFRVDVIAERLRRMIEDDGEMGGLVPGIGLFQELPQHVAEALNGAHRQAVRLARQGRERMIGAEDIAGAIDEIEMVPGLQ